MPLSPVPGCNRVFVSLFVLALSLLFPAGRPAAQTSGAFVTVSAASYAAPVAPESIFAGFGSGLAAETVSATDAVPQTPGIQLPTTLGGTVVEVNGVKAGLFFVSAQQINYLIPASTAAGTANVVVKRGEITAAMGTVQVATTAPALFAANSDGQGVPAGYAVRVKPARSLVTSFVVARGRLYIGTIHGVFVTTDNGASWEQINTGMEDIFVTGLAAIGDRLFAGFATGGVFLSEIPR